MMKANNQLTYCKPGHRFVFRYDNAAVSVRRCIQQALDFVADSELDFNCHDAAAVTRKLGELHPDTV